MRKPLWSKIRAFAQLLFWLLFITILIYTRDPIDNPFIYNLIPKLSVHLGIVSSIAGRKLIGSLYISIILLVLTFILGRFFCGWICPMGITIDAADRVFNGKKKNFLKINNKKINIKPIKYLIFLFSIILSIAGIHIAGIIDPLSLSFRTYGTVIYPYFDSTVKLIFDGLYYIPVLNVITEPVYSVLKEYVLDYRYIMFSGHLTIFFFFLFLLLLSIFARRFWCQSLCPLGAALALTSRRGLFNRKVDPQKCIKCKACVNDCRINAIYNEGLETLNGECIKCFECLKSCEYDAISFKFGMPVKISKKIKNADNGTNGIINMEEDFDFSRRSLLMSLLSSVLIIPVFKIKPGYSEDHLHLIRPPGAQPEDKFINYCIRCGECMKVCPTNALHPAIMEAGLEGIFTPRLIPRLGYCEKNCILCTKICPTDAIKELKVKDKETTIFGTAYFIKDLCIPWAEGINCIVCEEMCPTKTKAIRFLDRTVLNKEGKKVRVKLPYVIEKLCIGCGICENKCPVPGKAAVRVMTPKIAPGINRF